MAGRVTKMRSGLGRLTRLVGALSLVVVMTLGSGCNILFHDQLEDFEEAQVLLTLLRGIDLTPFCRFGLDTGTPYTSAVTGTLAAGETRTYYYTAATTNTYTFSLTVSSGDADLYATREAATASALFFLQHGSVKPGTATDSLALSLTGGSYRCLHIKAPESASYSLSVTP